MQGVPPVSGEFRSGGEEIRALFFPALIFVTILTTFVTGGELV